MFNFKVTYDANKWKEMEDAVHNIYSNHPDPRSAEAAYSVSNVIADAFPTINRRDAMRNSQKIIENFTGYKLDTQGAWTEFVNTAKAQASDLEVSMKFSGAMLEAQKNGFDSDTYKQKLSEAMQSIDSQKLVYRSDFKDMSLFTDLLTETGRIVPSMIPSMGIYLAGGLLAGVTGGASLAAAKAGGAIYSGMMEAGSVAKELFRVKDAEGNPLNQDYILSAWSLAMAGVGALNLVTDGFEKVTAGIASNAMKKIFSKQAVKELVKSGTIQKWGQKIATDYIGKGIIGEAAEEAIEEFIGMAASNYVMKQSNMTEGTLFEGHSREEIIKTMAQTALSTAKGMILVGLPSATISTIQEYQASDTNLKMNANRVSGRSENSFAVPMSDIKKTSAPIDGELKKVETPVKVIKIGDTFKPADEQNASVIASLRKRGAKALNVEVVEGSSEFNRYSIASARSLGQNYNKEVKNGVVLFDDQESMKKVASEYAMSSDTVFGYHEEEGQIILDRRQDEIEHSVIFRTKEYNETVKQNDPVIEEEADFEPVVEPVEETQTELDEQSVLIEEQEQKFKQPEVSLRPEEAVKKTYNHLQKTLKRKGATDTEQRFINDKLIPQIHDVIKNQFPDMSEEQVYETAIPSAYFAFVTSKVAGMTTDEFFSKHFTPEAFIALTANDEKKFLKSQAGIKSIEIQTGNSANEATLFGLTIPKKGKNTIGIGRSYSPLTVVHEMGHVMVKVIKDTEAFKPFLEIYKDQLSQDGGKIGVHFQEAFAKDLEQYFIDGKVRDSSLKTMFKKIGDGIRELLHLLNPMLDNETRRAFDKLFDFKLEQTAKAKTKTTAPQMELDIFGDPEKVVGSLAKLSVDSGTPFDAITNTSDTEYGDRFNLSENENEFGTTNPTAKKKSVNPVKDKVSISMDYVKKNRTSSKGNDLIEKLAEVIKNYDWFDAKRLRNPDKIVDAFKEFAKDNLRTLYNMVDPVVREQTRRWYIGANRIARRWSIEYSNSIESISAAIANLSPQKDWFQNVSLAQRLMDIVTNKATVVWDDSMTEAITIGNEKAIETFLPKKEENGKINYDNYNIAQYILGKSLEELIAELDSNVYTEEQLSNIVLPASVVTKDEVKNKSLKKDRLKALREKRLAAWIRLYDETHNDRSYRSVGMDGSFGDYVKDDKGQNKKVAWGSFSEIASSYKAFTSNGDAQVLSDSLGNGHKVRNFYNNILVPMSKAGYVTIDTHAVAAALFMPLSGTTKEVNHNFGSGVKGAVNPSSNGVAGIYGTYPIYAQAYIEVAEELGILPRELQSVTWEAIRKLFTEDYKTEDSIAYSSSVWKNYFKGNGDINEARRQIVNDANEKVGNGRTVEQQINEGYGVSDNAVRAESSYERTLPLERIRDRGEGSNRGAGSRTAVGFQGPGSQRAVGGDGRADNQRSSGVWADLETFAKIAPASHSIEFRNLFNKAHSEFKDEFNNPITLYHGSDSIKAIEDFDNSKLGSYTNAKSAKLGHFFAKKLDTSMSYTQTIIDVDKKALKEALDLYGFETKKRFERIANLTESEFKELKKKGRGSFINPNFNYIKKLAKSYISDWDNTMKELMDDTLSDIKGYIDYPEDSDTSYDDAMDVIQYVGNSFFHHNLVTLSKMIDVTEEVLTDKGTNFRSYLLFNSANILIPAVGRFHTTASNPYIHDYKGTHYRDRSYTDVIEYAKNSGYDSVILKNTYDGGPVDDIVVIFDPEDVYWNADSYNAIKGIKEEGPVESDVEDVAYASIKKSVTLDEVKNKLSNNEYPSDADLKEHAGDPDVDWEIQFRRIMVQDVDVYKTFEKALEKAAEQIDENTELTPAKVLEVLKAEHPDNYDSMLGEVRDPDRFINRLMWQSKFLSPSLADKQFKKDISNFEKLKKIVETILQNRDPGDFRAFGLGPLTQFMVGVKDESKMTGYKIREVKKELLDDLRNYRRMYYENLGLTQQLSYEDTVKGTYLDEGNEVEAFGNEEIRKLLESSDTDPILKELIRKNLATGNVLQNLVDETTKQIEELEIEVMVADDLVKDSVEELAQKTEELEQANKKFTHTDKMYKKLQKTNTKNYENMRVQKRMNQLKAKRIQYMKAKQQMEKHLNSINGIVNSKSPNNDARMMEALRVSYQALKESQGQDLTSFFAQNGVEISSIPDQLMQYFTVSNAGVFSKMLFSDIDLTTAAEMHKAVIEARRDARIEKSIRDMELKREIFKLAQSYAMSARGASWDDVKTEDAYRTYMANEKLAGNVQKAKNKYQAFFETKFITMSRVINKIDPEGNTIKPFIFGGYDRNGVFHRGIEGVLDDEKREEYKRYQSMRQAMEQYGITEKALLANRVDVTNGSLTLEQAMGVYIYAQQSDALEKLTSPNGNKFVIKRDDNGNVVTNEIELVVNSLTDEERAFADWMKDEMGSRWKEISDIYYKVNNKTLGYVANYFPLIRSGERVVFEDLMQDQFLRMQETPDDSITRDRVGGDYELQLNAFSIWNKMVAKQEHYIAGAEFFNKANRLMHKNGGDLYNLIAMNNGKEYATALQDFLNRVANKRYIYDDADSLVNKVRSNLVVARLGFNLLTTLKQLPAFGLFAQQFGVGRLFEAIAHMSSDYKGTSEFIYDKSPQMRGHSMSIDFSSFTQMETKTEFGRKVKKIGEVGMTPIQFIDGFIKKTLWYGAYQNNIANGMTDEQASMEATKWINDTQPGGTTKDSAAIYDTNSTIVKYLLMFTNQLNKNMNIVYDIPYAIKNKMYEKAFKNMVGLGISLAGIVALEGGFDDEDDDDKMWDDLLRNFSSQFISMFPVIGPDVSDIVMDRYYSDSGMPLVSEVYSFTKAIGSGDKDRIIDRSVSLGLGGAEFVGLPSGQTKKIWDAFTEDGKVNLWYLLGRDFVED